MSGHPSDKLPQARRTEVFAAARVEFVAHGYRQASLNRIIAALGMSKSSFYHYFSNKADLFECVLEEAMRPLLSARDGLVLKNLTQDTYWPAILGLGAELNELVSDRADLVDVGRMFYRALQDPRDSDLTARFIDDLTSWVGALIERGQDLGQVRGDLPQSYLVDLIISMGMSTDRWMLAHWDDMPDAERRRMSERILQMFVGLLSPLEAGR